MTRTLAQPETESVALPVLGMTCASCQHHVESALQNAAGVQSAHVDLMANRANVVFDPTVTAPENLINAIREAGYDAVLPHVGGSAAPHERQASQARSEVKAWVTLAAGAVAMGLAMPLGSQMGAADHFLMRLPPSLYESPHAYILWSL